MREGEREREREGERGRERERERERDGRVSQRTLTCLQLFLGIAFLRFDWIGF